MRFLLLQVTPRFPKMVAVAFAVLTPFIWLTHWCAMFNGDMENMYWMTAYESVSIRETGLDSLVFQTPGVAGIPFPLFYAWGYVVFNGALTALIGPVFDLRVMMMGALAAQFLSTLRLGTRLGLSWTVSYVLSCTLGWSIYSLTNLYTRSDLMEYFGVCNLISALCCLLTIIIEGPSEKNRYEQVGWGFYFLVVSMSHPITLVYGGITLALCGLIGLALTPWRVALFRNFAATFMAWTVTMGAWLFLMSIFLGKVVISQWFSMAGYYSWTYIDGNPWNNMRNTLWPLARAVWPADVFQTGFDVQIASALLVYVIGFVIVRLVWRREVKVRGNGWLLNSLAAFGFAGAVLNFFAATDSWLEPYMVHLFYMMQFPYRGISYVNIGLFLTITCLLARVEFVGRHARQWMAILTVVVFLWTLAGYVTKMTDATITLAFQTNEDYRWWNLHHIKVTGGCDTFGGYADYNDNVTSGIPQYSMEGNPVDVVHLPPSAEPHLSELDPQDVDVYQSTLIVTQVMCFPWNHIYVDGKEVPRPVLGYVNTMVKETATLSFWVTPGHHRISYKFIPNNYYVFLRCVALIGFLLWFPLFLKLAFDLIWPSLTSGWAWGIEELSTADRSSWWRRWLYGCLGVIGLRPHDWTKW